VTDPAEFAARVRRWARGHERAIALAYLAVLAVGVGIVLPTPLRGPALRAAERAVARYDRRWTDDLERGERLLAEGRFEEAAAFLQGLDARFPARDVKHARDDERKRVLRALAAAEDSLGHKRATLAALGRLVEFDPRDYASLLTFAEAARRLGEDDAALDAYGSVLAIHPIHLAALRHSLQYRVDAGDFGEVAATFDRFVESLVLSRVGVSIDSIEAPEYVPVDGRFRNVTFDLEAPEDWSGELRIETEGFGIEVASITVEPPLGVGVSGAAAMTLAAPELGRAVDGMVEARPGVFQATTSTPALVITLPPEARRARRLVVRVRLLKLVDEDAWSLAETGYRNVLSFDRLAEVADRVLLCSATDRPGDARPLCDVLTWPGDI